MFLRQTQDLHAAICIDTEHGTDLVYVACHCQPFPCQGLTGPAVVSLVLQAATAIVKQPCVDFDMQGLISAGFWQGQVY